MPSELRLPPVLFMLAGALILPLLPRRLRAGAFVLFPLAALAVVWLLPEGQGSRLPFLGYELILCEMTRLTRLFGTIFALIAAIGGVYSFHQKETGQQSAALLYAGGALGVTFAGDYLTLFVFWELMAIASTYLIWARRTREAENAGMRYLLVHLFGGGLLLLGILMHISKTGSLEITSLLQDNSLSSWLMLGGVALNAAVPPLHAWLADAYPKATVTGAVFLSAFTTKSAVLILIRMFSGWDILLYFGVIMTLYGVVYAVLSNDIRGILAYHIISQVGYMVAGVGIGTEMAINGTAAHAYSHILYKALLFMGAGAVLKATGKSKLTELGGLARAMPLTLWLYMIGAFSISGFPLFNGFISKSMVVSAAGAAHRDVAMLLLLLASVGTFLSVGLKLPYFTWWNERKEKVTPARTPINMHIGMGIAAFLCILYGVYPELLYRYLPFPVDYHPYTLYHLNEVVQISIFTFVAFWLLRGKLAGKARLSLDTDWAYRAPAPLLRRVFVDGTGMVFDGCEKVSLKVVSALVSFGRNPVEPFKKDRPDYDPDRNRNNLQFVTMFILVTFVVFALTSLLR